jgi:RNase P subunit RPR2
MDETEAIVQRFWDLAVASCNISPSLSRTAVLEMLEAVKSSGKSVPEYFRKLFCLKCFSIFSQGRNCKILVRCAHKHPNLKVIEYHCLSCGHTQRMNCQRSKAKPAPPLDSTPIAPIPEKRLQQKRK